MWIFIQTITFIIFMAGYGSRLASFSSEQRRVSSFYLFIDVSQAYGQVSAYVI